MSMKAWTITYTDGTSLVVTSEANVDPFIIYKWANSMGLEIQSVSYKYVAHHFTGE